MASLHGDLLDMISRLIANLGRKTQIFCVVVILSLIYSIPSNAGVILDGSFESGGYHTSSPLGNTYVDGAPAWIVTGSGLITHSSLTPASDGFWSIRLDANSSIQQTLTGLEVGELYRLTFDERGCDVSCGSAYSFSLGFGNQMATAFQFFNPGNLWVEVSSVFVADSESMLFSLGLQSTDLRLDNFRLTKVPEPTSLGLISFGLGILVFTRRRMVFKGNL